MAVGGIKLRLFSILTGSLLVTAAWVELGWSQDSLPAMNARDAFYSAGDMLSPKKSQATRSRAKPSVPGKPVPTTVKIPASQDAEAYFQKISAHAEPALLGLRYSLLQLQDTEVGLREVKTDSVFHSGDMIRVSVMGNQKGYLYVVSRGSGGTWTPFFPNPESTQKDNRIVPGRKYEAPGGDGEFILFDQQAGAEKLFLLFSRTPAEDLEEVIRSLREGEQKQKQFPVLQASNRINDEFINRLRGEVQSRDLVFTRIGAEPVKLGETREEAVYVVNQSSSGQSNSRVVVDLTLKHQ